jgi:imidazolonepropionase-like amidohydrolase
MSRLAVLAAAALLWLAGPAGAAPPTPATRAPARRAALTGATVFDGTGGPMLADAVVLLEGERIVRVGRRGTVPIPPDAVVHDFTGKWILPGLVDAHIHFFQSGGLFTRPDVIDLRRARPYAHEVAALKRTLGDTLRRYLASGVTSVVDMGGPFWNFEVREQARRAADAPRVAVAGPLISSVERQVLDLGDPPIIRARTPEDARRLVRAQLPRRPDLIKVWCIVTKEVDLKAATALLQAVVAEAHAAGVRVAVHATELDTARAALQAGADVLVHSVQDRPVDEAFVKLLAKRGIPYIPALTVMDGYADVLGQTFRPTEAELRLAAPEVLATFGELEHLLDADLRAVAASRTRRMRAAPPVMRANLARLHRAGVLVAAGTDAGNIGTLHGPALHRELERMAEAGMDRRAVLLAATRDAARVAAVRPDFGTLVPGNFADLLVVDADPTRDLRTLARPHRVIKGGVVFAPAELVPPTPAMVVQAQVEAYNARDLERFVAFFSDDVVIARHPGGATVARGRAELRRTYATLFAASPELKTHVLRRIVQGALVVDHEMVTGIRGRNYLHAVATYEVRGGLIRRVWLSPSE